MDLEQYKKLAFKNNTFEIKALEESLNDSKMNAYQYLRQFQLESTGYRRFDFNMQDIYRTNKVNHVWSYVPRRWLFFIDYEFINVGKPLSPNIISFALLCSKQNVILSTFDKSTFDKSIFSVSTPLKVLCMILTLGICISL